MSTSPPLVVADRYRLVAPLGQGGMGRVWRASDVVLHRDVAIKELVPPPGLTPEERQEMRERSLREARAIARLNNINVVRVFDVLRTDADPWIVMEYVPSRSLQDILAADGPMTPVRAAEVGLGVLNALRAAHRNGVVHRDVKPGNVLIGEDGRVVLTDFGLATVPGDPNVTRTGLVLGSPAYIAPERARDGTAGPGADLWSLGATLYAAVEGASPFARPSAIATLAALATENPPPSRNAGPMKPVLNGLLRKDPAHRINAEEAERLLLRAAGRRSKLSFPMSPTMRRPGAGRERPALPGTTPVVPGNPRPVVSGSSGVSGSAPVVPGPRPPVSTGRPPSAGHQPPAARPPVQPDDGRRPPVFVPGKATVGRPPRPAPDAPKLDATRVDTPPIKDFPRTGKASPPAPARPGPEAATSSPPTGAHGALARGTRGAFGTISAAEVAAHRDRQTAPAPPVVPAATLASAPAGPAVDSRPPATDDAAPPADESSALADTRVDVAADSPPSAPTAPTAPPAAATRPDSAVVSPPTSAPVENGPVGDVKRAGGPLADAAAPSPIGAESAHPAPDTSVADAPAADAPAAVGAPAADAPAAVGAPAADASAAVGAPAVEAEAEDGTARETSAEATGMEAASRDAATDPAVEKSAGSVPAAVDVASPATADHPKGAVATADPSPAASGKPTTDAAASPATTGDADSPGDDTSSSGAASSSGGASGSGAAPSRGRSAAGTPAGSASTGATSAVGTDVSAGSSDSPDAAAPAVEPTTTSGVPRKPAVGARAGAGKSSRKKGRGRNAPRDTPAAESSRAVATTDPQAAAALPAGDGAAGPQATPTDTPPTETGATSSIASEGPAADSKNVDRTATEERGPGSAATETGGSAGIGTAAATPGQRPADPRPPAARTAATASSSTAEPATTVGKPATTAAPAPRPAAAGADGTQILSTGATNARADSGALPGVPGFPGSRRPAWQPMGVPPRPASKRGLTVLGTTLTRRQTAIGALILAAVLLTLILLVPRAFGDDQTTGAGRGAGVTEPPVATAGATPAASAPAAPPPATTATTAQPSSAAPSSSPATSSAPAATVPRGFRLYEDPTGFSVPLPSGWRAERRGSEVYFEDGGRGGRLLIIDQTDQPKGDPVADWKAQEADRQGSTYRNYERIRIDAVRGYYRTAADWEFRYTTSRGNPQHAQKRGFVTGPNKAYGISFYTSPDDWEANEPILAAIYKGFTPAKS